MKKNTYAICNASPPECTLHRPALGDFSRMSRPLLVAAESWEQFEEFRLGEYFLRSECKRITGDARQFYRLPDDKILLLLPDWHEHPPTVALVEWWVSHLDRYTVELSWPAAPLARERANTFIAFALAGACAAVAVLLVSFFIV